MARRSDTNGRRGAAMSSPTEEHEAFLSEHRRIMRKVDRALDELYELAEEEKPARKERTADEEEEAAPA